MAQIDLGQVIPDTTKMTQILEDTTAIKPDVATIKSDTSTLKTDTSTLKSDTTTLKADVTTLKGNASALLTNTANIKKDTEALLADVQGLSQDATIILNKLDYDAGPYLKRYGFKIKKAEANSANRVEYILDAVGMTPATMDRTTGVINYGSWENLWFVAKNKPCMMKFDGTVDYYLDPDDYSKREDGETESDYNNVEYEGDVMAAIPLCWVKRYEDDVYEYFVVCEEQYDSSYHAYAHTSTDGTIKDFAYHAAVKSSLVDGKLRSICGQQPESGTNTTQERNYAKAGRTGNWDIKYWSLHSLIADLCTLIAKNDNSQAAFGEGYSSGTKAGESWANSDLHLAGRFYDKGQFYGVSMGSGDTAGVKVFHIEDFWANRWDRCLGLILDHENLLVKMTPEGDGYNLTGAGYTKVATYPDSQREEASYSYGYQKDSYMSEYGRVPISPFTGSSSTYTGDYFYWNTKQVDLALLGGYCDSGAFCGSRSLALDNAASHSSWASGASLTFV